MKKKAAIVISAVFLVLVFIALKSFTPPILANNSIAQLREVSVNGDVQTMLLRGRDRSLPVLLFLHGGPGMPAMYLAHDFQRDLEDHFVVVHWDQRAAGKSYRNGIDPNTLTISQLLDDTNRVVDYLLDEFKAHSLWLVGHSHGTYIGALYARSHPEKVAAYVGLGQIGDFERSTPIQDEFLSTKLPELGLSPDLEITGSNREELLFKTGSEIYGETSFMPLILSGLMATEYSLSDIINVAKGSSFSSQHMTYDRTRDLISEETEFDLPVAIIMGSDDMTTPISLAREYYDAISAPDKRFFTFPQTAHFPHYEQPERFLEVMLELKELWQ